MCYKFFSRISSVPLLSSRVTFAMDTVDTSSMRYITDIITFSIFCRGYPDYLIVAFIAYTSGDLFLIVADENLGLQFLKNKWSGV